MTRYLYFLARFTLGLLLIAQSPVYANDARLLEQVRQGGLVLLMRHALAPGTFDPEGFTINNCVTQRNLNQTRRDQAKRIGQFLAAQKIQIVSVKSSQWCRCLETARLAFAQQQVVAFSAINSPTGLTPEARVQRTEAFKADILNALASPSNSNSVYVTHMFNVQDLTGESLSEGEILVLAVSPLRQLKVLGRLKAQ